jgi:small subunit ribosomal protein S9
MADESGTPETEGVDPVPEGESPEAVPEAVTEGESPEAVPEAVTEGESPEAVPEAVTEGESPEAVISAEAEEPAAEPAPEAARKAEVEYVEERAPREKPAVPGADLEVDIVPEGVDPLAAANIDPYAEYDQDEPAVEEELEDVVVAAPIEAVAIDLAAGARYSATGKRKSAIARVTLRPGSGSYLINGRTLAEYFPRDTLQRNIRQPLETVGYEERMDVIARMHGGGVSSQAGALRHGISRALLEADPNLRGELKRRGFLTRDARAKERKKAGLKKARKRPQFSKR